MLLSKEYLTLVREHLAPGGVFAYNTTASPDALYTANAVFPFAFLYDNFAVCSDFDWRDALERPNSYEEVLKVRPLGRTILTEADRSLVEGFLSRKHSATVADVASRAGRPLEIITDRNLITEYRYGRPY